MDISIKSVYSDIIDTISVNPTANLSSFYSIEVRIMRSNNHVTRDCP